jgi:hypothetical protein
MTWISLCSLQRSRDRWRVLSLPLEHWDQVRTPFGTRMCPCLLLSHIRSKQLRKYHVDENNPSTDLTDLHDLTPPPKSEKKNGFWTVACLYMCVCMYGRMCPSAAPKRQDFVHILYLKLIHQLSVPIKYEYSSSKNRGPPNGPQKQNCDFLKNV